MNLRRISITIILLFATAGCYGGKRINMAALQIAPTKISQCAIGLRIEDAREVVKSGQRRPSWVGQVRNTYGIPAALQTLSGRPFSDELTDSVRKFLFSSGATQVVHGEPEELPNNYRGVNILIHKFKSDSALTTRFEAEISIRVTDRNTHVLGKEHIVKDIALPGSIISPRNEAVRQISTAVSQLITDAFSRPAIEGALRGC